MRIKVLRVEQKRNEHLVGKTFEVTKDIVNIQSRECYSFIHNGEYYNIHKPNAKVIKVLETVDNIITVDFKRT